MKWVVLALFLTGCTCTNVYVMDSIVEVKTDLTLTGEILDESYPRDTQVPQPETTN